MVKIYHTPEYEKCLEDIYVRSAQYRKDKPAEIKRDVLKTEQRIAERKEKGDNAGKLDPEHHSNIFRYVEIPNTQKLFFCDFGDDVVMVFAGNATRQWNRVLDEESPFILQEIKQLKQQHTPKKSDKAKSTGKIILPRNKGDKKPPAPQKSQQQDKDDHER